jgi:hypothetical protein
MRQSRFVAGRRVGSNRRRRSVMKKAKSVFTDAEFAVFYDTVNAESLSPVESKKSDKWHGACFDTGAQKTVIGEKQARAYCRYMGTKFKTKPSRHIFKFGVDVQESMGTLPIRIPTPNNSFLLLQVEVVPVNVPFLIGLDVLDIFSLNVDTVHNKLCAPKAGWEIQLIRKMGHVYLEWSPTDRVLYTKAELTRLHRGFYHPTNKKLLELLRRARMEDLDTESKKVLEDISAACVTCQYLGPKPVRFRASLPSDDLIFGDELSIDLFWVDGAAVLQVVDVATKFTASTFLDNNGFNYGQSIDGVWAAFIDCWATTYTGYPNKLRTDAGSIFVSPLWKQLTDSAGVTLQLSGVESHNSIAVGERLHEPLRRTYRKVAFDCPGTGAYT